MNTKKKSQDYRTRPIFRPNSSEKQRKIKKVNTSAHVKFSTQNQVKTRKEKGQHVRTRPIFRPKSSAEQCSAKKGANPLAFTAPSKSFADHLRVRRPQVENHCNRPCSFILLFFFCCFTEKNLQLWATLVCLSKRK